MEKIYEAAKGNLSESAAQNVVDWLEKPKYAEYRDELVQMIEAGQWQELEDGFFKIIEFGTGGRRGTTGIGSNRINRVTMGESAQALCEYAKRFDAEAPQKGVVIACDTRLSSPELSEYVATVCAANGFTTYIFDGFRSTPELSFALRELGCAAGIVVSASHNPPADNGFKAYWSDGGQLVPPHDKGVLDAAADIENIASCDYQQAVADGQIVIIDDEIDQKYIAAVVAEAEGDVRDLKIVYSPLHGAGQRNTLPVLEAAGFAVDTVEAQMVPDGNFPTVQGGKPNPEEKSANDMAVDQMLSREADIAITNDPDADRIGVIVRQGSEAVYLNGNQSAVLATEYALRKRHEKGSLVPTNYIAKTIVTTDMINALAAAYNVKCYGNMLIGFKYIGELILAKENTDEEFVIGGEESYGLLKGTYTRDKDGAVGALPLAEYAAELKQSGKTLWDRLLELFGEHGVYAESLDNVMFPGAKGFDDMQQIMSSLRSNPPKEINGHPVTAVLDYKSLERKDVVNNTTESIDCISGNVVVLEFGGDKRRRVTIRPSGTEPKIKIYAQWYEAASSDVESQYHEIVEKLKQLTGAFDALMKGAL